MTSDIDSEDQRQDADGANRLRPVHESQANPPAWSAEETATPNDLLTDEERLRLAYLWSSNLLDTEPERSFDDIVTVAARVCKAPAAAVSLVDADRVWLKAKVGLDEDEWPRARACCAAVVALRRPVVVEDLAVDSRDGTETWLGGPPGIRAYAGWPLQSSSGAVLGSLCLLDVRPRRWRGDTLAIMPVLAGQVAAQIELRRARIELTRMWERQRDLEWRFASTRDDERHNLAVELNDGLAQDLAGISFLVMACRKSVSGRTATQLRSIIRLLQGAMRRCRTMARGDFALRLCHSSLRDSLQEYVAHVRDVTGLNCFLEWTDGIDLSDRIVTYNLFGIAQEAITNAVLHSGGFNIAVTVRMCEGQLFLNVTDDGCGLPSQADSYDGAGLEMMKCRATAIGGVVEFLPALPRGLSVRCSLKLRAPGLTPDGGFVHR